MTMWSPNLGDGRGPRYVAIARAIESDVLSGRLAPGGQLPTHRDLADRLRVTVGTVSRAYAEARKAGWISGEVGRGTFVLHRGGAFPHGVESSDTMIDLGLSVPVDTPAPDLGAALRAIAQRDDAPTLLRYTAVVQQQTAAAG